MGDLNGLDRRLAELRARHPGWNIWYVPKVNGPTAWCAQPEPLLNADSADGLSAMIAGVEDAVLLGGED